MAQHKDLSHRISELSLSKFNSLPKTGKPILNKEWTVLSTIVQHDTQTEVLHLVSLGTGTKCLTKNDLNHQGTKLNDSHAETMTRRGFIRYLFEQIDFCIKCQKNSIFLDGGDGKFKLKQEIEFHFFTTHLPCGDASISEHSELGPPEAKKARLEQDSDFYTGARLISTEFQDSMAQVSGIRTKPGRGVRTLSVSCSDKLLKWNLMGIQGALLSTLLVDPIYFKSLILIGFPREKAEVALKRALIDRYETKIYFIKPPFRLNTPIINVISDKNFQFSKKDGLNPSPSSIVWCSVVERSHEVSVDGKKLGATKKQTGPKGRLLISKIEILRTYLNLVEQNKHLKSALFPDVVNFKSLMYDVVKARAKFYNGQWQSLMKNCIKLWTVKPDYVNKFCID